MENLNKDLFEGLNVPYGLINDKVAKLNSDNFLAKLLEKN